MSAPRPCTSPGCLELVQGGSRCDHHRVRVHQPKKNREAHRLYNRAAWRKLRQGQLAEQPLCEKCQAAGVIKGATVVDHKEAHRMDLAKFYDRNNLQSLCKPCHDSKTASQDGGFGNPGRGQG